MSTLVRDRFLWVEDLRKGLVFLLGDSVDPYFQVKQAKDPLTAFLTISLKRPLPKASRDPIRVYIRMWAKTGDCEVPRILISNRKRRVLAEVLFKHRHPKGKTLDENRGKEGVQPDSGSG